MMGYLSKQGKNPMNRWQQRFFVLSHDRLDYWLDEKAYLECRERKGTIDLAGCTLATAEQHTIRPNTFGIFHIQRRDVFFEAPDQKLLMDWIEQMEKVLKVQEKGISIRDFDILDTVGEGGYGKVVQVGCNSRSCSQHNTSPCILQCGIIHFRTRCLVRYFGCECFTVWSQLQHAM